MKKLNNITFRRIHEDELNDKMLLYTFFVDEIGVIFNGNEIFSFSNKEYESGFIKKHEQENIVDFVFLNDGDKVGYGIIEIDYENGNAFLRSAIHESYQTEFYSILTFLCDYVFNTIHLYRCWGVIFEDNSLLKNAKKFGFEIEGILRENNFEKKNSYILGILKDEYKI